MSRPLSTLAAAIGIAACATGAQAATVMLGSYAFDSTKFGDSVMASDGGVQASTNWLNVVNVDPGLTGALTGAHFDTGVANIGLGGSPVTYTIGYAGGLMNGAGADLGIVVARFSSDNFDIAFDGGPTSNVSFATAAATGEFRAYFYQGAVYTAQLYVHLIDLSDYGYAMGASIGDVSITGSTELDLIRAAGVAPIPEPESLAMLLAGLAAVGAVVRRRR